MTPDELRKDAKRWLDGDIISAKEHGDKFSILVAIYDEYQERKTIANTRIFKLEEGLKRAVGVMESEDVQWADVCTCPCCRASQYVKESFDQTNHNPDCPLHAAMVEGKGLLNG